MGMDRVGRGGSIMLIFVPFRDGGCDIGGYPLDAFTVKNFNRGCSSKGLRGSWKAGVDRGQRGGYAGLLSNCVALMVRNKSSCTST